MLPSASTSTGAPERYRARNAYAHPRTRPHTRAPTPRAVPARNRFPHTDLRATITPRDLRHIQHNAP